MLVYGDHSEFVDSRERLDQVAEEFAQLDELPPGLARHAQLVAAFLEAGRLLQGVADAEFQTAGMDTPSESLDRLSAWFHGVAAALCRSWDSGFREIDPIAAPPDLHPLPARVELRVPEGFAFYALYPEAYIEAARRLTLPGPPRVIGIRSIGTSLGAAVAAALGAPPAVTVRPTGDPFDRRLAIAPQLERGLLDGEAHFVIVDEGPGQSGSSFGAVADWLQERGVPLKRIAFLPSHGGAPGPRASARHRSRWDQSRRAVGDFGDRLPRLVQEWVGALLGETVAVSEISGGAWRRRVYSDERAWPPAMPMWERRKFIAESEGPLLVKFAGLGAIGERKLGMARALHSAGLVTEPIGLAHGFLVERWCERAAHLAPGDKPLAEIARYLGARARLFPAAISAGASLDQLLEMVRRNASLALGHDATSSLDRWRPRLDALQRRVVRVRVDGRLDLHEWLRLADGRLLKTDALDHHAGHDLVGCQDLAWDVAGAISEFGLETDEAAQLVRATEQASGRHIDPELLQFCRTAYAAFRLGQSSMAMDASAANTVEGARLRRVAERHVSDLRRLLPDVSATRHESLVD